MDVCDDLSHRLEATNILSRYRRDSTESDDSLRGVVATLQKITHDLTLLLVQGSQALTGSSAKAKCHQGLKSKGLVHSWKSLCLLSI